MTGKSLISYCGTMGLGLNILTKAFNRLLIVETSPFVQILGKEIRNDRLFDEPSVYGC